MLSIEYRAKVIKFLQFEFFVYFCPCFRELKDNMRMFLWIIASFMLLSCAPAGVKEYKLDVVAEYPHDVESYTQGLFFQDGQLYESTGLHGKSTFRKVDLTTGEALEKIDFNEKYFIEGSVMFMDNLYVLTWETRTAFVYDANTLEFKASWKYPREGWGITTDGKQLIASDGSSILHFMDENFKVGNYSLIVWISLVNPRQLLLSIGNHLIAGILKKHDKLICYSINSIIEYSS